MLWLAQQGHEVIGVELSPVAVADFFRESGLQATQEQIGDFTVWRAGRLSILCGDFFALTRDDLGELDTVYDRAALTALPENIRELYVAQLQRVISENATVFLLTVEDAAADATQDQANGIDDEIRALYSTGFDIELTFVESVFEADPESASLPDIRAEYKVYRLSCR